MCYSERIGNEIQARVTESAVFVFPSPIVKYQQMTRKEVAPSMSSMSA